LADGAEGETGRKEAAAEAMDLTACTCCAGRNGGRFGEQFFASMTAEGAGGVEGIDSVDCARELLEGLRMRWLLNTTHIYFRLVLEDAGESPSAVIDSNLYKY
jgi:hypothetical protein